MYERRLNYVKHTIKNAKHTFKNEYKNEDKDSESNTSFLLKISIKSMNW